MSLSAPESMQIAKYHFITRIDMTGQAICLADEINLKNVKAVCLNNYGSDNGTIYLSHKAENINTEGLTIEADSKHSFEIADLNQVYVQGTNGKKLEVQILYHG